MSEPRYRKLLFYCHHCKAFRVTYEPDKEKLFGMLIDGINFENVPAVDRHLHMPNFFSVA